MSSATRRLGRSPQGLVSAPLPLAVSMMFCRAVDAACGRLTWVVASEIPFVRRICFASAARFGAACVYAGGRAAQLEDARTTRGKHDGTNRS
ncbi:hypothetical protein ACTPOK_17725 [Streptomyces inhibens]|uniref:hypothetical protein n=1 Tax=Streptomyces inhibens TaxID=2293571 RepID=UPI00402AA5D4